MQSTAVDLIEPFFAPAATDLIDGLIGQYNANRQKIDQITELMQSSMGTVVHYFVSGNSGERQIGDSLAADRIFQREGAVAALNADYWNRALRLTDVLDVMPQSRRNEWFDQIRHPQGKKKRHGTWEKNEPVEWEVPPLPDFQEETVRDTLAELLTARSRFFAERVDGIFRSLSRAHVTNRPEGFYKRMIIARALNDFGSVEHRTSGVINDLRCVVARFMGRDEPKYGVTDMVIKAASHNPGQWMDVDGGALRLRVYNGVGTAHLEVHPDMAWRLNAVLASLYPLAIPSEFREKPKRKPREFRPILRPLPFGVVTMLAAMREAIEPIPGDFQRRCRALPLTRAFQGFDRDKDEEAEAGRVLEAIGGVREGRPGCEFFRFDYEPAYVLDEIVCSGCVPDSRSHQFYPTPEGLARQAVAWAEIGGEDLCLEPSAGIGGLAGFMPKDRTYCVELSALHCKVLEAKGHQTWQGDFLAMPAAPRFDRCVMNPPFADNRAQLHLQHAAAMLKPGGCLVAILPASHKGKDVPGFACEWAGPYANEFAGASVSVVMLKATKQSR